MAVEYRGVERWPHEIREKVEKATEFLRETMDSAVENVPSAFDDADVRWELQSDSDGLPQYILQVTQPSMGNVSATVVFTPEDFRSENRVAFRISQAFSELLRRYERWLKLEFRRPVAG